MKYLDCTFAFEADGMCHKLDSGLSFINTRILLCHQENDKTLRKVSSSLQII